MLGGAAGFGDKQMCEVEVQGKEVHNEEEGLIDDHGHDEHVDLDLEQAQMLSKWV